MSMAKQIFYHNLRKGNKAEVETYNRYIKPYVEKERKKKLLAISYLINLLSTIERIKEDDNQRSKTRKYKMAMAKQIYYHNLRKANKVEVELCKSEEKADFRNKTNVSYSFIFILIVVLKIIINLTQI